MAKAYCPQCDAAIGVDRPRAGAMVTCRRCTTVLEIISTNPLVVDFTLDYGQEWDDEGDDEDDRRVTADSALRYGRVRQVRSNSAR